MTETVNGAGPVFAEPATAREAIERVMAFSSRDWSAMPEVAAQFGWTPEQVATLRRLHEDWGRGR